MENHSKITKAWLTSYPAFEPPGFAATKDRFLWTKREAQDYFDWFMSAKDARVLGLLKRLELKDPEPVKALDAVGEAIVQFYRADTQVTPTRDDLTEPERAVAADIGLLLASALLAKSNGVLHWRLVRKPKNYFYYNLPVISGFKGELDLDPINVSMNVLRSIKGGSLRSDAWSSTFATWYSKLGKGAAPFGSATPREQEQE